MTDLEIVLITGMSGSGKSVALHALEDAGYYCVDNLPPELLADFVRLQHVHHGHRVAIAIDARSAAGLPDLPRELEKLQRLKASGVHLHVLFLDASTSTLVRRFSETRRRHPLSQSKLPDGRQALVQIIEQERELLGDLREYAHVIDTSNIRGSQLQSYVKALIQAPANQMTLVFQSFGFKHGIPVDADYVFDVRMLPNPHYDTELRPMTGRDRLPPDIGAQLPEGAVEIQRAMASYLASKAGTLATTGRAWLSGLLFAYVGLLIGALAAARPSTPGLKPLAAQLHLRVRRFGETFRQIVVAQFWIALFNTCLTAVFLLAILPLTGHRLPYTMALILLTFVAGLIPIVGNLICNGVLTLVGLSVSPGVALACLAFLIAIHKAEYFINAKVIGHRTHMGVWELLSVMFVMEAVFGPAGLVAAPLFYAYGKKELQASGWV